MCVYGFSPPHRHAHLCASLCALALQDIPSLDRLSWVLPHWLTGVGGGSGAVTPPTKMDATVLRLEEKNRGLQTEVDELKLRVV